MAGNGSVAHIALQKRWKPEEAAWSIVLSRLINTALSWASKKKSIKIVFGYFAATAETIGVKYHQWGLGTDSTDGKFKSLGTTVEELGHKNREINIFKIDCEGCELQTAVTWFSAAAKYNAVIHQILVKVHGFKNAGKIHAFSISCTSMATLFSTRKSTWLQWKLVEVLVSNMPSWNLTQNLSTLRQEPREWTCWDC